MQELDNGAVYLGHRHQIKRTGVDIDHRSARDPQFGHDVSALGISGAVDRAPTGGNQSDMPINSPVVSVNGVEAVVLSDDI